MIKHAESHLDHNLTPAQVAHVLERFADRQAFFIESFELPFELGTAPCSLHGPVMGDLPVADVDASWQRRGTRAWDSRVVAREPRDVRTLTVIAGPHEETCSSTHDVLRIGGCNGTGKTEHAGMHAGAGWHQETCERCAGSGKIKHACIIYTVFGGPLAPQEPGELYAEIAKETRALAELVSAWMKVSDAMDPAWDVAGAACAAKANELGQIRKKLGVSQAFWSEHALSRGRVMRLT